MDPWRRPARRLPLQPARWLARSGRTRWDGKIRRTALSQREEHRRCTGAGTPARITPHAAAHAHRTIHHARRVDPRGRLVAMLAQAGVTAETLTGHDYRATAPTAPTCRTAAGAGPRPHLPSSCDGSLHPVQQHFKMHQLVFSTLKGPKIGHSTSKKQAGDVVWRNAMACQGRSDLSKELGSLRHLRRLELRREVRRDVIELGGVQSLGGSRTRRRRPRPRALR